jgi:hypothetical protein
VQLPAEWIDFLVTALGHRLHPTEWVATGVITALYLASTLVDESARIALQANMHGNPRQISIAWDFPVLLFDILFLSWIYLALSSTIRILQVRTALYFPTALFPPTVLSGA